MTNRETGNSQQPEYRIIDTQTGNAGTTRHWLIVGCLCVAALCGGCESPGYDTRAAEQGAQLQQRVSAEMGSREFQRQGRYEGLLKWTKSGGMPTYEDWPGSDYVMVHDIGESRVPSILQERRTQFVERHPELSNSPEIKNAVLVGQVVVRMKANQVIASIGTPSRINRTVTQSATHEQWQYDIWRPGLGDDSRYLYFENGVLTGWQDSGR